MSVRFWNPRRPASRRRSVARAPTRSGHAPPLPSPWADSGPQLLAPVESAQREKPSSRCVSSSAGQRCRSRSRLRATYASTATWTGSSERGSRIHYGVSHPAAEDPSESLMLSMHLQHRKSASHRAVGLAESSLNPTGAHTGAHPPKTPLEARDPALQSGILEYRHGDSKHGRG